VPHPTQISAFSLMDFPQVRQWSVFAWVPVAAVGRGTPQWGQAAASVETSRPHSRQGASAMAALLVSV